MTWSREVVNKGRWLHPIQYEKKQQGTQNGEFFWKSKISYQANIAIFITDQKMQCQPKTSSKGNSSHPWGISNTKPLLTHQTKLQLSVPLDNINNMQHYISPILDTGNNKTMIVFMDGSTQLNPGPTDSGVIIKKARSK